MTTANEHAQAIERHILSHEKLKYPCPGKGCTKTFCRPDSLGRHLKNFPDCKAEYSLIKARIEEEDGSEKVDVGLVSCRIHLERTGEEHRSVLLKQQLKNERPSKKTKTKASRRS